VGASLKDLGKKFFGIATLEDEAPKKAVIQEAQTIIQAAQTQRP
jgi:hypothetical protein